MSYDKSKVTIHATYDDFCETHGLPKPHRVEFDRAKVNKSELDVINNYFSNLCVDLTLYSELFTEEHSISVLNKFNPLVFSRIQKAYIEKLCLSIACLLDPAETGKNKNLSLARIIKQCECPGLDEKQKKLQELYVSTGIKKWRQKLLAHNDLGTLMGRKTLDLKFEHDDVEYILELIQEIFNDISDPTVHTDIKVTLPFDQNGKAFINKLKQSLENEA
ncbi:MULTISPECIES: AbiU2 domain-containing protein [unclassified Pseudoalteromonas]|uniref:AbiU2 domain-containing protein n=1 Tax=unclassified Pseudoalteromonas TaxID=194690 RepID=UPI000BBE9983|nr:hypothetical protein [Pseudoalteromonas sp. 1_2015MBL_MicDiv]ATG79761.1 hypothetical protein AOR04_19670 [Pseudoalteromonas sp. 1_2015MBL_MicDiv]